MSENGIGRLAVVRERYWEVGSCQRAVLGGWQLSESGIGRLVVFIERYWEVGSCQRAVLGG